MASHVRAKKELTGRHVLVMLLGFFGVMIAVNGYFLFAAITSFRGEDVKRSYRQGLEYNQTIASREKQRALGWTVSANFVQDTLSSGKVIIEFRDANNTPLEGLSITGVLRHPTNLSDDLVVMFNPQGKGRYVAIVDEVTGTRQLRAQAQRGKDEFRFQFNLD